MTEFEAAVILATVKRDPGAHRRVVCATVGMDLGRPASDESVVLTFMDSLEGLRLIQRFHAAAGYFITPSGEARLKELREQIRLGLNLINASY